MFDCDVIAKITGQEYVCFFGSRKEEEEEEEKVGIFKVILANLLILNPMNDVSLSEKGFLVLNGSASLRIYRQSAEHLLVHASAPMRLNKVMNNSKCFRFDINYTYVEPMILSEMVHS